MHFIGLVTKVYEYLVDSSTLLCSHSVIFAQIRWPLLHDRIARRFTFTRYVYRIRLRAGIGHCIHSLLPLACS